MLNEITLDHTANPFDFIITTKSFLLQYLKNVQLEGENNHFFEKYASKYSWSIFQMPQEKTDGILLGTEEDGVYLWHAFPRNSQSTVSEWTSMVDKVTEKYNFLFNRFSKRILSGSALEKVFVVSNTQKNLRDFGKPGCWKKSFAFDDDFFSAVNQELQQITANCYKIIFVVRSFEEFIELSFLSNSKYVGKSHILFAGETGVNTANFVPQLLREMTFPNMISLKIPDISGSYDNGCQIVKVQSESYSSYCHNIVYNKSNVAWGVITCTSIGCYAIFNNNCRFSMVVDGKSLYFSNKSRWRKVST